MPDKKTVYKRPTKKHLKEQVQKIIDRNPVGLLFSADDLLIFNDLVNRQFIAVKHMVNPTFSTDSRHIHVLDEIGWDVHSWKKDIYPPTNPERTDMQAAMRGVIAADMKTFRDDNIMVGCSRCGTFDNLTCDHNPSFISIATAFIEYNGEFEVELGSGGPPVFVDDSIRDAWLDYHYERVTYALLCVSCNASKGST